MENEGIYIRFISLVGHGLRTLLSTMRLLCRSYREAWPAVWTAFKIRSTLYTKLLC
jgi:hypothetical protein